MSANVNSIKDRMSAMRAEIDQADQAVRELQTEIEKHTERAEIAEEECKGLNTKLRCMDEAKGKSEDDLKVIKMRMEEIETESEENRRCKKVLESRAQTNSNKLRELEELLTQQNEDIERLDRQNQELQKKAQEREAALDEAEHKGHQLKCILDEDQEEVTQLRNSLKSLEASGKKMVENEEKYCTLINKLKCEIDDKSHCSEDSDSASHSLQNQLSALEDELEHWKDKCRSTQQELDQTYAEINEI